tara:strand:- start:207 stop:695 length:489 start_codon:yes stop_codon:yes gene_type:complete
MARITVEDCIDKFPSRFELVLVASNRARKLHTGENPTVDVDNDKNTVIALREIAEETLKIEELKNDLIEEYQTTTFTDDEDLDELEDNSDDSQSEDNIDDSQSEDNIDDTQSEDNIDDFQSEVNEIVAQESNQNDDHTIEEPFQTSDDKLENSSNEDKSEDS